MQLPKLLNFGLRSQGAEAGSGWRRNIHNAFKGTGSRVRKGKGWKVSQMWTKGGKEERSFIDAETFKTQESGRGTGNARSPGDAGLCWKESGQELST